jgi:OOP family OmpA-OmpF porin
MKKTLVAAALALGAGHAMAIDLQNPYFGVLAGTFIPDPDGPNERPFGTQFFAGIPLNHTFSMEPSGFIYYMPRKPDGKADLTYGAGVDFIAHKKDRNNLMGFLLAGYGVSYADVTQVEDIGGYANAGFGLIRPVSPQSRWSVRGEFRAVYDVNHVKTESRKSDAMEYRFSVGVQRGFLDNVPLVPVAPPVIDTDSDGVPDTTDLCPGTPPGTPVDATGCPAAPGDADGDGVPDALDQCPDTPADTPVDAAGCPVKATGNTDDDGDGIANELDKCPNTPAGFKVDAVGCLVEQTLALQSVNFEFDSDRLTSEAKAILDGIATGLGVQQAVQVLVVGHTDALGPQSYNLSLSQKRAKAVINYLTEKGVASERLKSEGEGEFTPIASNDTEAGRAQNRRVEFKVLVQ